MAQMRPASAAALLCGVVLLGLAAAQQDLSKQGEGLEKLRQALKPEGWLVVDTAVDACAEPGTVTPGVLCSGSVVTDLNLRSKGMVGKIPADIWALLPGIKTIDFSDNPGLEGTIPAELAAEAGGLLSITVAGTGIVGPVPAGLSGKVVGVSAPGAPATAPPAANATVPPAANATAPPAANATAPAPAGDASPLPAVPAGAPTVPGPATPAAPAPTEISAAPVCACALQGVGSADCLRVLKARCSDKAAPEAVQEACSQVAKATSNPDAAAKLAEFLAGECFEKQSMASSPCSCFQDPNSNDCAKARLNLCIKKDSLCVPFQIGSDPAAVAAFARDACPLGVPDQSGVQINMTFPKLGLTDWTAQLTQSVGNAIAATAGLSSSSVSLADARPVAGGGGGSRRRLLQGAGAAGVQAVYFASSSDPDAVNTRLQLAASDGSFAKSLASYGVPYQPSVALKTFYGPALAGSGSSGFPLWALAPIVVGVVLVLALVALGVILAKKRGKKRHAEFAPAPIGAPASKVPVTSPTAAFKQPGSSSKDYHSQTPFEAYATAAAGPAAPSAPSPGAGAAAAAAGAAAAATAVSAGSSELPVSRSVRVPSGSFLAKVPSSEVPTLPAVRTSSNNLSVGSAASGSAAAAPAAAAASGGAAQEGPGAAGGPSATWKTSVRPATAAAAAAGAGAMSSLTGAKGQQAERAKFWAQFQETWQQVRETKRLKEDGEPGTPSSGTNWTETTGGK